MPPLREDSTTSLFSGTPSTTAISIKYSRLIIQICCRLARVDYESLPILCHLPRQRNRKRSMLANISCFLPHRKSARTLSESWTCCTNSRQPLAVILRLRWVTTVCCFRSALHFICELNSKYCHRHLPQNRVVHSNPSYPGTRGN